jgi:N-methylhydantoinase A
LEKDTMPPATTPEAVRLAVDIGGTFTDVVLETPDARFSVKVLTTKTAPEDGVLDGILRALKLAKMDPGQVGLIVHGTTLATNAIIERKGAKTALVTTKGFRDSIEMAQENRFEQYDIFIEKPEPLVPRTLRFTVPERVDACTATPIPRTSGARPRSWPQHCPACASRCPARSVPRCANTNASRRPAPTPMCSR